MRTDSKADAGSLAAANPSIARNSLLLGIGDVLAMAFGFLTTLIVIDRLGDDYGVLIGAQRFVGIFLVVAEFGLAPLVVRRVASRQGAAGELIATAAFLRVWLSVVYVLVVVVSAEVIDYLPDHRPAIYLLLAVYVVTVFSGTLTSVLEGLERMGRSALVTFARSAALLVLVLGVLLLGGGLFEVVMAYLVASLLQLVTAAGLSMRLLRRLDLRVRLDQIPPLVQEASLFVGIGMAFTALRSLDVVMLTRLSTTGEVAVYGAALNFLEVLMMAPLLVQRALLPAFSRLEAQGESGSAIRGTLVVFSAVLVPSAVGLSLLAEAVVALYPSGEFGASAPVLRVLATALVLMGPSTVCATYLTGVGRLRLILLAYALVLPSQAVANWLLIPVAGAVGVAWATVGAHALLALCLIGSVVAIGVPFPIRALLRHLVAAGGMGAIVWATRDMLLPIPVACGVTSYVALLALLCGHDSPERRLIELSVERWRSG